VVVHAPVVDLMTGLVLQIDPGQDLGLSLWLDPGYGLLLLPRASPSASEPNLQMQRLLDAPVTA